MLDLSTVIINIAIVNSFSLIILSTLGVMWFIGKAIKLTNRA